MTRLHDDLAQLTATQPAQPGDRLAAVTGRARRIRRTRVAASALSVLAVVGVGAALLAVPSSGGSGPDQLAGAPGTPITLWADRSDGKAKPYSEGAVAGWDASAAGHVAWVYRGLHEGNNAGEETGIIMIFRAQRQGLPVLVTATIEKSKVASNGYPLYPASDSWSYQETSLSQTSPRSVTLPYFAGGDVDLFVLEAPGARTLTWKANPLPGAAAATTSTAFPDSGGTNRSQRGVFRFHVSKVLGPLTYTVTGLGVSATGTIPEDAVPLVDPDAVDYRGELVLGTGGALSATTKGYALTIGSTRLTSTEQIAVRCYGGGVLTLTLKGRQGVAPCDGASHDKVLEAASSATGARDVVQLTSDRLQMVAFVIYR